MVTKASARGRALPQVLGWLGYPLIAAAVLAVVWLFVWDTPRVAPVGDAYVHFVYARNLALRGELIFNPGIREGVGSTSILWVLILASLQKVGLEPVLAARTVGTVLLTLIGVVAYDLVLRALPKRLNNMRIVFALVAALLMVLPGNMVWLALSGMETVLFTFLGVLALNFYLREKWLTLGICLGLLVATRVEGVLLAAAIVCVEFLRHQGMKAHLWRVILPNVILIISWLVFFQLREGVPYPTSFEGKSQALNLTMRLTREEHPELARVLRLYPAIYLFGWTVYILLYLTGNSALPGPRIVMETSYGGNVFTLPYLAVVVMLLFIIPLMALTLRQVWRRRRQVRLAHKGYRLGLVFLLWLIGHNLVYAVILPQPGGGGRYAPMNHFVVWGGMLAGVWLLRNKIWQVIAAMAVASLLGLSVFYWQDVYTANLKYMTEVRLATVKFVEEYVPAEALVASSDIGPIRYYGEHTIIDLMGYVNREVVAWRQAGRTVAEYLAKKGICNLAFFEPGDAFSGTWASYSGLMGLEDDPSIELVTKATFSIPIDEWNYGGDAVRNYMPAISVREVYWHDGRACGEK